MAPSFQRRLLPLFVGVGLIGLGAPSFTRAQELVGCSLVNGQLSCVPGVSSDPQTQIRALRGEIAATLAEESQVQQQINALQDLVLAGETQEGALLQASLEATALAGLPPSAFHWYRLSPGAAHWVWISGAQGPSYALTADDVGTEVMLVVVQVDGDQVQRHATAAVGPIQPAP